MRSGVVGVVLVLFYCSKKNLNASRPSEHPPVRGENVAVDVAVGVVGKNNGKRLLACY